MGRFREDLFYRLNVFPLQMPPLRDRLEDLPALIEHLIDRQAAAGRRVRLDTDAMFCLACNRWPGNVRELSNLLERLAILFPGQLIGAADLPSRYRDAGAQIVTLVEEPSPDGTGAKVPAGAPSLPRGGIDLKDHLTAIEVGLIRRALEEADGTVAEAARLLKIRRTTLVEKLRKYQLSALTAPAP
jgi:sigma-54 specific flagellar transcriptional regulator A